jgi:hypothetical protein
MHEIAIAACARWESPYILEWLLYYQSLGLSHVFLYCNDDEPSEMFAQVLPFTQGARPFVTFHHHRGQGEQWEMYAHFLKHYRQACEWFGFFDIDEFLRLAPDQKIADFMIRFSDTADAVLFNWANFGPNGHKTPPVAHVLSAYTKREADMNPNTKYLARSSVFTRHPDRNTAEGQFWHSPSALAVNEARIVNVLGEDLAGYTEDFPRHAREFINEEPRKSRILNTAVLHHYAFRSEQSLFDRTARGIGGNFAGQTAWRDVAEGPNFPAFLTSTNAVEDDRLAGFWPAIRRGALNAHVFTAPAAAPVSRFKPAMQSSISQWSRKPTRPADAAGAVDGAPDGGPKFHTSLEFAPWWAVDLGGITEIAEIRVFNRIDDRRMGRLKHLALSISNDARSWREIARKTDDEIVGGIDGDPYIWRARGMVAGRFVRVRLLGRGYLHLDQVEVFGHPVAVPQHA